MSMVQVWVSTFATELDLTRLKPAVSCYNLRYMHVEQTRT